MNTIRQLSQYAKHALKDSYPEHEVDSLCTIIFMDVLRLAKIDIHLKKNDVLPESFVNKFRGMIELLKEGHPLQYVVGETEFLGRKFRVNPSTLIPRPETGELVRWAAAHAGVGGRLLDIGTGSGCIAVSLACLCPGAEVEGVDISAEALAVAAQNAAHNGVEVLFRQADILNYQQSEWRRYDMIVSNPPYVRESEKAGMQPQVLLHEPHGALFVPDGDPLLFYRRIAEFGQEHLREGGHLFFEINEAFGAETATLLEHHGYTEVEVRRDFDGRERMAKGIKTNG